MGNLEIKINGLPLDVSPSMAITYGVKRITDVDKTRGFGSKTVTVPRTKNNEKAFGLTYNSIITTDVNKSVAQDCTVTINTLSILKGTAKILNANLTEIEFFIIGNNATLKELLGDLTLRDLNLSDLTHTYSNAVAFDTWDGIYPVGVEPDFCYPFIDYGAFYSLDADIVAPGLQADSFYPAVYVKRIVRQIFKEAGLSLTSSFFDKVEMSKLFIPFTGTELRNPQSWADEKKFRCALSAPQIVTTSPATLQLDNDSTGFNFDNGSNFDTTTFTYTVPEAAKMSFNLAGTITALSPGAFFFVEFRINGSPSANNSFASATEFGLLLPEQDFNTGDTVSVAVSVVGSPGDTATIGPVSLLNSVLTNVILGSNVQLAPNLPNNVKQMDFLRALIANFNLYIDLDYESGAVLLETHSDYYNVGSNDWTRKLNLTNPPRVSYVDSEVPQVYQFNCEDSEDYYIEEWNDIYNEPDFGNGVYDTGNDYVKTPVEIEVPFAATKIDRSFNDSSRYLNLPSVIKENPPTLDAVIKLRLLINAGMVSVATLSDGTYTGVMVNSVRRTEVPLSYFVKPKYAEAIIPDSRPDQYRINLAFNLPNSDNVTWNGISAIDAFYTPLLQNYDDLRVVEADFVLSEVDMHMLNMRKLIYFNYEGFIGNYILSEISDYNPSGGGSTTCTLIKLR